MTQQLIYKDAKDQVVGEIVQEQDGFFRVKYRGVVRDGGFKAPQRAAIVMGMYLDRKPQKYIDAFVTEYRQDQ